MSSILPTGTVGNQNNVDADEDEGSCNPYDVMEALNDDEFLAARPDAIIMADINMTPRILYWTHDRTVAGNYHRDNRGIKDNYVFFRDMGDATAKAIASTRGIDFVLICGKGDDGDYSYSTSAKAVEATHDPSKTVPPENTLYTRLVRQDPPGWLNLRDWPEGTDSQLMLYQVELGGKSEGHVR